MSSESETVRAATGVATATWAIDVDRVSKSFGLTRAVDDMSLSVAPGHVVGVIGPNGAGKSTLMRLAAGEVAADTGRLTIGGEPVDLSHFSPRLAHERGVRTVHQELSLCTNLRVFENFLVEFGRERRVGLRAAMKERAAAALELAFPGSGISPDSEVSRLSLAQQQMVEIARAVSSTDLRVLILDEPTSALPADRVEQLRDLLATVRSRGVATILITHRLTEVLDLTDNVVVMRNGSAVWRSATADVTRDQLVAIMSGGTGFEVAEKTAETATTTEPGTDGHRRLLEVSGLTRGPLRDVSVHVDAGEIVGIYGLEGSGQRELLRTVFDARRRDHGSAVRLGGEVSFVSGDRRREGLFPLWPIAGNLTLSSLPRLARAGVIKRAAENEFIAHWLTRLAVKTAGADDPITALSGGNQQKVVIARALGTEADLVILDDPTRGVDPRTKGEVFELLRESAHRGRAGLIYSTEELELLACDRVYVLSVGAVVAELSGEQLTRENLVTAAFQGQRQLDRTAESESAAAPDSGLHRVATAIRTRMRGQRWPVPVAVVAVMLGVLQTLNQDVLAANGLNLLIGSSLPLVLAAIAQMFVVAVGDIDLGLGSLLGLVNVIGVTWLTKSPLLGALSLVAAVLAYMLLGALVHVRRLPAIVATLGASFVWLGLAQTVLPMVGGEAPSWLIDVYSLSLPVVPEPVLLTVIAAGTGWWVMMRTRFGVLLRGFGNNSVAISTAGWSTLAIRSMAFGIAGVFGVLAGLALTAVTTSGDASAAQSYTLLSVTAVIIGGSEFIGGVVEPVGVVAGAVTLSLVGVLLSLLGVDPNFTAAVEGLILILVLAGRSLARKVRTS
ncbi:ATP-binding cassette domain-containing protein [Cellulomonas sp. P24]|uniref:ATP-binding cassette domain-containing protein n=1 Tax=Cellulomonas sp. P24 TaxID=2885206 RepID=UPI00216AD8B9|nr:ATP-binding cassette domain-containing protein [Cellulomonas sp. P24]MCR6493693.1 ATP-binding cassette domain-containing protein [Cellulomonas sp. P24]